MKRSTRWVEVSELAENRAAQPPNFCHRARRSRSTCIALIAAMLALFVGKSAVAQPDTDFTKANQEYAQGHFKDAIADYEALVYQGQRNSNLFYDLGNAYFRTGDF